MEEFYSKWQQKSFHGNIVVADFYKSYKTKKCFFFNKGCFFFNDKGCFFSMIRDVYFSMIRDGSFAKKVRSVGQT